MVPAQVDDLEDVMDTLVALAAPQITEAELNELRSSTQIDREAKETSPLKVVDIRFQMFTNNAAGNAHPERFTLANVGGNSYDASKGAVMSLTRVLAMECARGNIRVNVVRPGVIDTAINRRNLELST